MTEHWDNETWKKWYKSCFFISTLFSIQVSFVSKRKLSYPCLVVKSTNKLNFIKSLTQSNIILEVPVYLILIFSFGAILLFIIKYEKNKKRFYWIKNIEKKKEELSRERVIITWELESDETQVSHGSGSVWITHEKIYHQRKTNET